jgi:hypothetical protein
MRAQPHDPLAVTFSIGDSRGGTFWMSVDVGEPDYFVGRYYKPDVDQLPSKPCK